jgi:phosphatidylserine decarboxylase
MLFFHRDPERYPLGEGMVSPADGWVVSALPERIAIFMGLWDVHVNRSPLDGLVRRSEYRPGGHLPAFWPGSFRNQQNLIEIETADGTVELRQITGAVARRIVSYVRPEDRIRRGDRVGMIRFGSRVEVTIPEGYKLSVKMGDRVRAGETIIAVKSS